MRFRFLLATILFTACLKARADKFTYTFQFDDLRTASNRPPLPDFSITIDESALIDTTGVQQLPKSLSTPLGYDVNYFGENIRGIFKFDAVAAPIYDGVIPLDSTTFVFNPTNPAVDYLGLGTYNGFLIGNESGAGFSATASVTIAYVPSAATPEPSSLALLSTGTLGIAGMVRRRLAERSARERGPGYTGPSSGLCFSDEELSGLR